MKLKQDVTGKGGSADATYIKASKQAESTRYPIKWLNYVGDFELNI